MESAAETPLPAERTKLLEQLRLFRDRLLNLDPRNRCLFVRRTHKKNNIDLAALGPECCEGVVWKAIVGEGEALLVREAGATEQEEAARVSLKALHREGVSIFEETGLHVLYVGFCWLEGHLDERTYVRGPLALVQAKLTRKTESRAGWYVTFDDAVPVVNRALLAALTKYRGVRTAPDLPDRVAALFEQVAEDKERSVAKAYTATTNLMTQAGVPAQMTPYSSSRTIQPLLRADLDRLGPQPLQFVSYHVLGLFPQSETALFADMEALIDRSQEGLPLQRLVGSLLDVPSDKGGEREPGKVDLDGVPASELSNVLPSDPSQDEILVKAKKAACVVVRGPPGTGKSQVIVNLIANCLAAKERVLLVCQKRAALDVVYDRLDQIGLSNIAFLVHDAEADRPALYKKLGQVLSGSQVGADEPRPEDVTLDQTIDQLIAQIRSIVEPLRTPIHGVEPYRLYARARHGFEPLLDLPQGLVRTATFQGLHRLIALIRRAQPGAIRYDAPSGLARLRGNWRAVGVLAKKKLADSLRLIVQLASDGQYTYLDGEAFREQMLAAIGAYQTFRDRWYRPFLPSWYGGKRALRILAHRFRDVPVEEWQPRIRRGAELSGAIQATAGFMHPEWLDTACTRIGDTPWLLAAAKELLRLVEEEFGEIQQHDQVKSDAQADELVLLQECACKLPAEADWGDHVTQEIYLRWIDEMEDKHPIFRGQPFQTYAHLRGQLVSKLEAKSSAAIRRLAHEAMCDATTPVFPNGEQKDGNRKAATEWNKLAYEVGKKRRLKPLRTLLRDFGWPLRRIAPCWLASPDVVSAVFPLEEEYFDLLIFDEASQLAVERSLPAICRAKRIVVAGDEQQMPPTDFFRTRLEEEEASDEDQYGAAAGVESLLVLAKRIYGFNYLSWHYRSEHQELINFSNHAYYDGKL